MSDNPVVQSIFKNKPEDDEGGVEAQEAERKGKVWTTGDEIRLVLQFPTETLLGYLKGIRWRVNWGRMSEVEVFKAVKAEIRGREEHLAAQAREIHRAYE